MELLVDSDHEPFLADHLVEGSPLLPTVMALDLMAGAAVADRDATGAVMLRDVVVGAPIRFPDDAGRRILVDISDGTAPADAWLERASGWNCSIRVVGGDPATGFAARVLTGAAAAAHPAELPPELPALTLRPADIYPPYFHGPSFQVIGGAAAVTDGIVAVQAASQPRPRWSTHPAVIPPEHLELCLQAAGLWELGTTGRMMIPDRIETVVVPDPSASVAQTGPVVAVVTAVGVTSDATFDATVYALGGAVLLQLTGYHTVDLGQVVETEVVHRIATGLGLAARAVAG